MSLPTIVSSEKSEHLIYGVLPLAIAIWISSQVATDPFQALGYVSVISSLLTLVLYEMRIDEIFVKRWYSRDWGDMALNTRRAFLSWDLLLNSWDTVVSDPPQFRGGTGNYEWLVKRYTDSVVSSYVIRKRLWAVRGSLYLFLAVPFIVWTGLDYLSDFLVPLDSTTVWLLVFLISIVFWTIQYFFNRTRHKPLRTQIRHLVVFRYAQQLVAYDALACELTGSDERTSLRSTLLTEFEFLDQIIIREDWSTFTDRWVPIRWNTELRARRDFIPSIIPKLFELWIDHRVHIESGKRSTPEILSSSRRLAWYIHVSRELQNTSGRSFGQHTTSILSLISDLYDEELSAVIDDDSEARIPFEKRLLLPLTNPVFVLSRASSKLLNDTPRRDEQSMQSFSGFLLEWLLSRYDGRLDASVMTSAKAGLDTDSPNEEVLVTALSRILGSCQDVSMKSGIWANLQADQVFGMLETLHERMKRIIGNENRQVLCSFLQEASNEARIRLLDTESWQADLASGESRTTLEELLEMKGVTSPELREQISILLEKN